MADDLIHLVEYAKGLDDPTASALIEQFGGRSDVIMDMPFKIAGAGKNVYARETAEPNLAFRAINADPEISHGESEELQDQCYPISGLLEVDRALVRRHGMRKQNMNKLQQMNKGAAIWTDTLIAGNNATDPKEFSGMQSRLVATNGGAASTDVDGSDDESRLLANGTGSGGAALSLAQLDLAIDLVSGANQIWMPRKMKTRMKAAARDPNISNNQINFDTIGGDLGRKVMTYEDIPIYTGYPPSRRGQDGFLPFTEVAYGGGAAVTCSIYVVSVREDGVCGIHTAPPEIEDIGHTDKGVHMRDLFEWDCGITIEDFYSAIRLSSITDAAIVA